MKLFNNKKGFTLIEIVVALGIVAMISGFTITSLSAIPQARMKSVAQTIKSEFELTKDFATTHGGDAVFSIKKNDTGLQVTREGANLTTETKDLKDRDLVLFYKKTGDNKEYQLGQDDASDVTNATLTMTFSQTRGAIIGPHMLDYLIISNGSKNYTLVIKQNTGMIYYDYELDQQTMNENVLNTQISAIQIPTFIIKGEPRDTVEMTRTGYAIQPELNYDARNVRISGVYRAIEKGVYTITFSLKDPYSTEWVDGTIADKSLMWKIK